MGVGEGSAALGIARHGAQRLVAVGKGHRILPDGKIGQIKSAPRDNRRAAGNTGRCVRAGDGLLENRLPDSDRRVRVRQRSPGVQIGVALGVVLVLILGLLPGPALQWAAASVLGG